MPFPPITGIESGPTPFLVLNSFSLKTTPAQDAASQLHGSRCTYLIQGVPMLWTIFAILIILWLLGWGFHVAGGLIHLLLVIALIVAVINLVTGRRAV